MSSSPVSRPTRRKAASNIDFKKLASGKGAAEVIKEKGFEPPMSDTGALEGFVDQVIAENPKAVEDIKGGNTKSVNFLTGQVMKLSRGKANPKTVAELINATLGV